MKPFKEIVIVSGKGGTGKTTLTTTLAVAIPNKVIADTDVDAANLHLLLQPENSIPAEFRGMDIAEINPAQCTSCGLCRDSCAFHAVEEHQNNFSSEPNRVRRLYIVQSGLSTASNHHRRSSGNRLPRERCAHKHGYRDSSH